METRIERLAALAAQLERQKRRTEWYWRAGMALAGAAWTLLVVIAVG